MGKHGRHERGYRDGYARRDDRGTRMAGDPAYYDASRRLPRKLPMAVVLVGLILWSLFAWIGYALVDPVLSWVAANAGVLLDTGKGLAAATEAGKEVGAAVDTLNVGGLLGQAIALLRVVLKPAIVIVWAIGALLLVAAPFIISKVGRLLARRRY